MTIGRARPLLGVLAVAAAAALLLAAWPVAADIFPLDPNFRNDPTLTALSRERLVLQTQHGDLHLAFYPKAAPKTVAHIIKLGNLGLYTTNHFFRVDKGFVAQTADVASGRTAPMSPMQREVAEGKVPLEVDERVKHTRRGLLSMARHDDPNSGGSSFSIMLGAAPHLNNQYTVFGEVTQGLETLAALEALPTRRDGIFVMPLERITILSTYMYVVEVDSGGTPRLCTEALAELQARFDTQSARLEQIRQKQLPGR